MKIERVECMSTNKALNNAGPNFMNMNMNTLHSSPKDTIEIHITIYLVCFLVVFVPMVQNKPN